MTTPDADKAAYDRHVMKVLGSAARRHGGHADAVPRPGSPEPVDDPSVAEAVRNRRVNGGRASAMRRAASSGNWNGQGGSGGTGGFDLQFATGRPRDPLFYWRQNNLPYDFADNEELTKVRAFCRLLYQTDPIIGSCVDIFSKLPIAGMELVSKDPKLKEFYDELFFGDDEGLDYEEFFVDMGREYYTCALPGELIQSSMGSVAVQDIPVGSEVLTHKGRWRRVVRSMGRHYEGRVFTVRPRYGMPIRFTEGHQFLVRRSGAESWMNIEDVDPGTDELFVPVDKTSQDKRTASVWESLDPDAWETFDPYRDDDPEWTPRYAKFQRERRKRMLHQGIASGTLLRPASDSGARGRYSPLAPAHELTDDLLRLFGLYLAEGSADRNGAHWAYSDQEQHLVNETIQTVKQAFGLEAKVSKVQAHRVRVSAGNRTLGAWFESLFGKGAKNKRMPGWMLRLPPGRAAFVLDGLFEGDGHAAHPEGSTFRASYKLTTSSPGLRDGAALLIRRAGLVSVISEMSSSTGPWWLVSPAQAQTRKFARYLGWDSARVTAVFGHGRDTEPVYARYAENGYWVRVHRLLPEHYEGQVYDLTVEEDSSFTCQVAVHNCGEAWPFATFNEDLGIWDDEELLAPEDIKAERSPFLREPRYFIKLPQAIREVLRTRRPVWEYEKLVSAYPELIAYVSDNSFMPVSSVLLRQLKFKGDTFNIRGIPLLTRAMRSVLQQEMLNSALDSIADRMYTPLVLFKLGASASDLGTEVPWIPTEDDLGDFQEATDAALAADFRAIFYNFAVETELVFGREQMPDLTADFERIEDRILQTFGLSRTFLTGAGAGETYAADALNKELISQLMTRYQKILRRHYRQRALIVAEAQEHYDYDLRNGQRYVRIEEVLETDEETGEQKIVEQPKLLIPELNFPVMDFRNEDSVRALIEGLHMSGVAISRRTRMRGLPVDLDEEAEACQAEAIQMAVMEQETRKGIYRALRDQGLPVPDDLKQDFTALPVQNQDPSAAVMARTPQLGQDPTLGDLLPNMAPTPEDLAMVPPDQDPPGMPPPPEGGAPGGVPQPPGQGIPQVPPESNEQRPGMPTAAALFRRSAAARAYARQHPVPHLPSIEGEGGTRVFDTDSAEPFGAWAAPRHVGRRRHFTTAGPGSLLPEYDKVPEDPE